jgi:nicotinamidase-related amidase
VKGTREWELHNKVRDKKHTCLVETSYPGSFTDTNLDAILKNYGCDTVVICGYTSCGCCDTTARQAYHYGYNVEFLSDATGAFALKNEAGKVSAEELHRSTLVIQATRFSNVINLIDWEKAI